MTEKLEKEIKEDIERCLTAQDMSGSEALYGVLLKKYTRLFPKDILGTRSTVKRSSATGVYDYLPELKMLAEELHTFLLREELSNPLKSKIKEFIKQGEEFRIEGTKLLDNNNAKDWMNQLTVRIWVNQIFIFTVRHLNEHPLKASISEYCAAPLIDKDIFNGLMTDLMALVTDEEFFISLKETKPETKSGALEKSDIHPVLEHLYKEHMSNSKRIFVVHGHDNAAKESVARFIEKLGFQAIILHEQPDAGRTIIEKIEQYTNVLYAVVLYTPCDIGRSKGDEEERKRARQNVVFEHGYLCAKLGRNHVTPLVIDNVETPGDISGIVYTPLDNAGAWKAKLAQEMKNAGLPADLNKVF